MMSNRFAGTSFLIGSLLRKNRIKIPIWILSIAFSVIFFGKLIPDMYTTGVDRQIMAETMKNPAVTVMLGPGYGLDNYNNGAMMAHFMLLFAAVASGMMGILLTLPHTREDEEDGRTEMIRSLPVGSSSSLTAAISVSALSQLVLMLFVGWGLYFLKLEGMDFSGSMLYGACLGAVGIFFSALTGLFAQLMSNTRATSGASFVFLITAYIVRGIGDVSSEALSLISPLGLILRSQVYVKNRWYPVWITLALSLALFAVSLYLCSVRDLGAGFIATKPGRSKASKLLTGPFGLSFRLLRTPFLAWAVGMFALGAAYGSVLGDLEGFIESSELVRQMIPEQEGLSMTEGFIALIIAVLSILGAVPVLMFTLKLRNEEKKNRTEALLSNAVSRRGVLGGYLLVALLMSVTVQIMSALGLWSAAVAVMEEAVSLKTLITAALVHVPAIWLMSGLSLLLVGFFPNRTGFIWLYLTYAFFVIYMGDMLKLPEWTYRLSPFGYVPMIPADEINFVTLLLLTFIAALFMFLGFIGYERRDLEG